MIKRVNPFLLVGFLALILVFFIILANKKQVQIQQKNLQLTHFSEQAKYFSELKKSWDQKNTFDKLINIINKYTTNAQIEKKKNKINIHVKELNKNEFDIMLKKILNEPFKISKLRILPNSKQSLSLDLEVKK